MAGREAIDRMDATLDELFGLATFVNYEKVSEGRTEAERIAQGMTEHKLVIPLELDDEIEGPTKGDRLERIANKVAKGSDRVKTALTSIYAESLLSSSPLINHRSSPGIRPIHLSAFPLTPAGEHIGSIVTAGDRQLNDPTAKALTDYARHLDSQLRGALQVARLNEEVLDLRAKLARYEGGKPISLKVGHEELSMEQTPEQKRILKGITKQTMKQDGRLLEREAGKKIDRHTAFRQTIPNKRINARRIF
jgi:hypothetical protein